MENTFDYQPIYYQPPQFTYYPYSMDSILNAYCFPLYHPFPLMQNSKESTKISQQTTLSHQESSLLQTPPSVFHVIQKENMKKNKTDSETPSPKKIKDENFQLQLVTKKQGSLYKKKNTESNIANQALAFINTQRSLPLLFKLLGQDQNKIKIFYKVLALIKKQNKKYVNRKYLKRLIDFPEKSQFHRVYLRQKTVELSLSEIRITLRKLIFYFLRHYCLLSLTTSLKIHKQTLREHYWRKREIFEYLFSSAEDSR